MNTKFFLRFSANFSIYLFLILAVSAYPLYKFADHTVFVGMFANSALFYIVTIVSFFLIIWATKKTGTMVNAFLAGTVFKMLIAIIYLLIVLKKFPGNEVEFALTFFAAYLICTGFEVYYILYNLRQI